MNSYIITPYANRLRYEVLGSNINDADQRKAPKGVLYEASMHPL